MIYESVTFAKSLSGELVVVLSVKLTNHSVVVGTRRPQKNPTPRSKYKSFRMFADGMVFQHGYTCSDEDKAHPFWYGAWEPDGDDWLPFDEYYEKLDDAVKINLAGFPVASLGFPPPSCK